MEANQFIDAILYYFFFLFFLQILLELSVGKVPGMQYRGKTYIAKCTSRGMNAASNQEHPSLLARCNTTVNPTPTVRHSPMRWW